MVTSLVAGTTLSNSSDKRQDSQISRDDAHLEFEAQCEDERPLNVWTQALSFLGPPASTESLYERKLKKRGHTKNK